MPIDPFITDNIITLCYIIDEFEEFKKRLLPMIQTEWNRDFISQLRDTSNGYFKIFASEARKFYKENKLIIDIINEYSNISRFICNIWDSKGEQNPEFQRIYDYILDHKDQINTIIDVLNKVKKLGFYRFGFDDTIDFTKETYEVYPVLGINHSITFVQNIQINNDLEDYISYKTTESNYKIELAIDDNDLNIYKSKIILNSLLFDVNSLPTSLTIDNTFGYIMVSKYEYMFQTIKEITAEIAKYKAVNPEAPDGQLLSSTNENYARKLNLKKEEE